MRDLGFEKLIDSYSWLAVHGLDSELGRGPPAMCTLTHVLWWLWPLQLDFQFMWKRRLVRWTHRVNAYLLDLMGLILFLYYAVILILLILPFRVLQLSFQARKLVRRVCNCKVRSVISVAGDTGLLFLWARWLLVGADGQLLFAGDLLIRNHLREVKLTFRKRKFFL